MKTRMRSLPGTLLVAGLLGTVVAGCGVPPGRAMESHRLDAPVWWTSAIDEGDDHVRITVRTPHPDDARLIARRIVNQRRSQAWRIIEVEVQDEHGGHGILLRSEHPHLASTLREGDPL